jgi:hypothetical protein
MSDEHFDAKDRAHESPVESGDENLSRYFQLVLDIFRETERYEKHN